MFIEATNGQMYNLSLFACIHVLGTADGEIALVAFPNLEEYMKVGKGEESALSVVLYQNPCQEIVMYVYNSLGRYMSNVQGSPVMAIPILEDIIGSATTKEELEAIIETRRQQKGKGECTCPDCVAERARQQSRVPLATGPLDIESILKELVKEGTIPESAQIAVITPQDVEQETAEQEKPKKKFTA